MSTVAPASPATHRASRCDVAIFTAWYPPEVAPFGQMMRELVDHLADAGLSVDVVTSVPNHPDGVMHAGWKNRLIQIAHPRDGVRIVRVGALLRSSKDTTQPRGRFERMAAFLVFTVLAFWAAATRVRSRLIFAVLQPLTIAPAVIAIAKATGARVVFNVQDLHPDAAISLGLLRNRILIRMLKSMERWAYRRADGLSVICPAFRQHCIENGAAPDKVEVIPNWIDLDEIRPLERMSVIRAELRLPDDAFVALFAGTIGLVSGAGVVVEAATLLESSPDVHVLFVGDGPMVPALRSEAARRGLHNVHFLPFQPRDRLNDVQSAGDVSLVTLLPGHGRTSVPSKVLGYMAAARPVIAAVDADSETARMITSANAGLAVAPQDAAAIAKAILRLRDDRSLARALGISGRRYLETSMSRDMILGRYQLMFGRLIEANS